MIKKSLAFAGTLYPQTCAQMRLYLDKVARDISEAAAHSKLTKNILIFSHESFDNIAHEALLGLMTLARDKALKRIFLLCSLQELLEESSMQESTTFVRRFGEPKAFENPDTLPLLAVCEAEVYALLAREIPAVSFAELAGILGTFAPKHFICAHLPTPKNEIFLPLLSYAFKEREIALCELFVSDSMRGADMLVQRILEDSSNAILLLQRGGR